MLKRFTVKGFKNFNEKCILDFSDARSYEYNINAIKDNIVKTSLIYGPNSSGKSNLGYALFDIIATLTDKMSQAIKYEPYISLENNENIAEFKYEFQFDDSIVEYTYTKSGHYDILEETLNINGENVIMNTKDIISINIPGANHLNTSLYDHNISFVKYVYRNTSLDKRFKIVNMFYKFIDFVEHMLLFKSLKINEYIGFTVGTTDIIEYIIKTNKIDDFQKFLHKFGIDYVFEADSISKKILYCKFGNKVANFVDIFSTGTSSLMLFYYWYTRIQEASFVFIDEFDAFYHSDVAAKIVSLMRDMKNIQVVLTTHNTDIMTNSLLRPDCYFLIIDKEIKPLVKCTEKELRVAHNLQKMYKAGAFN